ncbi:hypothetical protein LTR08_002246 [Meristemomyces frigidus]|nr:hypothetical protein LTR08_002246 [Meristemomyces frigidus]
MAQTQQQQKLCFVSVGATAEFPALINTALSADFLSALQSQGYTELLVQYGEDGKDAFDGLMKQAQSGVESSGLKVSGFALDKAGLGRYMRRAKGGSKTMLPGVVVCHAGSGTILDALRTAVPTIVVPNSALLDNHQAELAEALSEQQYVIHGKLDNLGHALQEAEKLRQRQKEWPPVNAGMQRQGKGLKGILDEEMGFLD